MFGYRDVDSGLPQTMAKPVTSYFKLRARIMRAQSLKTYLATIRQFFHFFNQKLSDIMTLPNHESFIR